MANYYRTENHMHTYIHSYIRPEKHLEVYGLVLNTVWWGNFYFNFYVFYVYHYFLIFLL